MRPLAVLFIAPLLAHCASVQQPSRGFNVSSENSDYSPIVRLAVAIQPDSWRRADPIVVTIDSAVVTTGRRGGSDTLPVMRHIYITALIVERPPRPTATAPAWVQVAASDSLLLMEDLRLGEIASVTSFQFRVPRPAAFDPAHSWLAFRISGSMMTREPGPNGQLEIRELPSGVRVFACTDWTLAGRTDRVLELDLNRAYSASC